MTKTIIVTGASRGIGAAICRQLRVQGVRVIGVARSGDCLRKLAEEKIGLGVMEAVVGDVSDLQVVHQAINLATQNGNILEALILNAGTLGQVEKVTGLDLETFRRSLEVNIVASIAWMQAALPHLRSVKGRIILTSSGVVSSPCAGFSAYCMAKCALNMLATVTAQEEPDITIMAVEPGIVDTTMFGEYLGQGKKFMDKNRINYLEDLKKSGNLAQPEDVAGAYAKLALKAPNSKSGESFSWKEAWIKEL